ncbi:MAG: hypothetical protein HZA68_04975 [Rhodovulum sp.]|nr:hypothetical protein [Rhodovulum sp.]
MLAASDGWRIGERVEPVVRPWDAVMAAALRRIGSGLGRQWYFVRSVGRSDRQVREWLELRGIEHYYPTVSELRPVPRKKLSQAQRRSGIEILRPHLTPMFPRYWLVRVELTDGLWHDVFRLGGLTGMVCRAGAPVLVSDGEIARLRACEVDGAVPGHMQARMVFSAGETVRLADGPFAGFDATVEKGLDLPLEQIDGEERIIVAVALFGQSVPVEMSIGQIDKV